MNTVQIVTEHTEMCKALAKLEENFECSFQGKWWINSDLYRWASSSSVLEKEYIPPVYTCFGFNALQESLSFEQIIEQYEHQFLTIPELIFFLRNEIPRFIAEDVFREDNLFIFLATPPIGDSMYFMNLFINRRKEICLGFNPVDGTQGLFNGNILLKK